MLRKQWTDVLEITKTYWNFYFESRTTAETSNTDLEESQLSEFDNNWICLIQEGQKNAVDNQFNEFV